MVQDDNGVDTTAKPPCWTDALPISDHVNLFRQADFGLTRLGPISEWPLSLRNYVFMVFTDSRAACVYYGDEKIAIYNEKFAITAGRAHPRLMGIGFEDGFPELWPQMKQVFDHAAASAQTVDVDNILLFPERKGGFPEETYWIGQFIPLRDDEGQIGGFYNTVYETTDRILHERRRLIVENIAAIPTDSVYETVTLVTKALRENPNDITMCLLYSYAETDIDGESNLHCVGRIGVPDHHSCAPQEAVLERGRTGFIEHFRQARETGKPVVLSQSNGSLGSAGTLEGISWCGYGEPSRDVTILSLSSGGNLLGFLVVGNNPRRLYDETTERSLVDVARQIEARWAASISAEQYQARERILEQRAANSESKLQHMAKHAPVGMCQVGKDEVIHFANDQFYEITGHDRAKPHISDYYQVLHPDEVDTTREALGKLLDGSQRIEREIRLRRNYRPPAEDAEECSAWILTVTFPLFEEDGSVNLILSYVLDISQQKWAESVQARVAAAALMAKRQQEEFIDTTSHEMRNPLTAILQLADGISESMKGDHEDTAEAYLALLKANVDSANTILACAAHQKRIIDDVLILSRLESDMLSFTPVPHSPSSVVHSTIKMFSGEVKMNGAVIGAIRESSYDELGINHTLIDPSRLAQVLINLLSNAIKFTVNRPTRKISVHFGASEREPPVIQTAFGELQWSVLKDDRPANSILPARSPDEELLYLWFYIEDSGPGMAPHEMKKLFKRFSQANPKTHIEYGGSGIGLYICQKLVEKQNGGVGVASSLGQGSVFGFYIETRRAIEPSPASPPQNTLSAFPRSSGDRSGLPGRALSLEVTATTAVPVKEEHERSCSRPAARRSHTEPRMNKLNLLLVEDNLINQRILAKQLRTARCTVTVANHGAEALQLLETSDCWASSNEHSVQVKVDVILLDWEMPVMDGLECCKRIRQMEKDGLIKRHLPVLAITANVRREQVERAMAAGFDAVMPKPFTVAELMERIREVVDSKSRDQDTAIV